MEGVLGYEVLSEGYDELYFREQASKYLLALSRVGRRHRAVLDLGCGTGLLGLFLESELLVGLDPCRALLVKARGRGYEVVIGVGDFLPFRDSCFDAVFSFTVVHECPGLVDEAVRVSRGFVVVSVLRKCLEYLPRVLRMLGSWGKVEVLDVEGVKDVVVVGRRCGGG